MKARQASREQRRFFGLFGGYCVDGLKDLTEIQDVGWLIWTWPGGDPVHWFWVSGTTFYKAPTLEVASNVKLTERNAVLEAIWAWERELRSNAELSSAR
jgi:hypothetical protein